jgi:hypothetical protein
MRRTRALIAFYPERCLRITNLGRICVIEPLGWGADLFFSHMNANSYFTFVYIGLLEMR